MPRFSVYPTEIEQRFEKREGLATLFAQAQAIDEAGVPRVALEFYEAIRIVAQEKEEHLIAGHAMLKQAMIYDRLGVRMSRDGYAVCAAEAFSDAGELDLAWQALDLAI